MDSELKQYLDELSERNAADFRQMREENRRFRDARAMAKIVAAP